MMKYSEAIGHFELMLQKAGFNSEKPIPELAWSVFKAFAREPVQCEREAFLVELGNFYPDENLFHLTLIREFWVMEDGEPYCEQLQCDFTCWPDKNLPDEQTFLWSYDFEDIEGFFTAVELLESFKAAICHPMEKWRSEIGQWMA